MVKQTETEYWQTGPVEGIPALLQPVAHALLQARREITGIMEDFPDKLLWERPAGLACVAFHLQHLSGVIDRLFTYARAASLDEAQLTFLKNEDNEENGNIVTRELVDLFVSTVNNALAQLTITPENILLEARGIGRKKIPTNVAGLLFHAAEHTQRHVGQLLVTAAVVKEKNK